MRDYGYSLESIERNYGSVAEYNRVMEEEYEYDYELGTYVKRQFIEPSEEELAKEAREHRINNAKVEALSGTPSAWAVELKAEFEALSPKKEDYAENTAEYYYACRGYSSHRIRAVIKEIKAHYGVGLSKEVSPYNLPEGEFAINIEDRNTSPVTHYSVRGLSYEVFKDVFRDLRYLRTNPTMFMGREGERNTLILSNSSLGSLRYYDFWHYGLETLEDMDKEALAFNKATYEANVGKTMLYNGECNKSLFKRCEHYHYIGQISEDDPNEYCYCDIGSTCSYDEMMAKKKAIA